jgi:amino acid transporter
MKTSGTKTEKNKNEGKLGTFSGVFTPSVLTILGIILFLRLGYVVGSAGFDHYHPRQCHFGVDEYIFVSNCHQY